jgi:uncharacterized membrane protein
MQTPEVHGIGFSIASNWLFVGVAYAAVWIVVGSYWLYVHGALKAARAKYDRAKRTN